MVPAEGDPGELYRLCSVFRLQPPTSWDILERWTATCMMQDTHSSCLVAKGPHQGLVKAEVFQGSSQYLLLADSARNNASDNSANVVLPPVPIPGCIALYATSLCSGMDAAVPYLRPDELVSQETLIPGLVRLDDRDQPTLAISSFEKVQVENANPRATQSVGFHGISFRMDEPVFKCALNLRVARRPALLQQKDLITKKQHTALVIGKLSYKRMSSSTKLH